MVQVHKHGVLLEKTTHAFESEGVLNPAVISIRDTIALLYRAVDDNHISTIGYCELSSPVQLQSRLDSPLLYPQFDSESQGLEDPRIVKIEGVYYLTYTAYDGYNALGALATSTDLKNWHKHGILVPQITYDGFLALVAPLGNKQQKYDRFNQTVKNHQKDDEQMYVWDKNLVFFPRKIDGCFCFMHRIKPDIQIVVSVKKLDDLTPEFWQHYFLNFHKHVVLAPKFPHEISYIGGGCPPIETPEGWLLIYHGVHDTAQGYLYSACAALMQLNNPSIEIARLPEPLFVPETPLEKRGTVNNVCFPTGALLQQDTLYIYYGAADVCIAVASVRMSDLLQALLAEIPNP